MPAIELIAPFKALPQGSKTAFVVNGRAVLTEAHKGLIPARKKLSAWLKSQTGDWVAPTKDEPVSVELVFTFERPKSVKREFHTVKPDADKLTRFCLDAIVQADLIPDDNQVVAINALKVYGERDSIFIRVSNE